MKNTFLYSLLLMIISAGSLCSQTTQIDVQSTTTKNQITTDQEHQKGIAKTELEPAIAVNIANKTAYKNRQQNRSRRLRCGSTHAQGTHQKAFSNYQRKGPLKYKRTQSVYTKNKNQ